jgi:fructosamine-3-kinase
VIAAAARALGRSIERSRRVAGGDINEAWQLELDDGTFAFLKSRAGVPGDEFAAEAAGLAWLAEAEGLQVPEVVAVVDEPETRALALEWIEPGYLDARGEEELGRGLAIVHGAGAPEFGSLPPGSPRRSLRFGGVEVPLDTAPGGSGWGARYAIRLEALAATAADRGRIDPATAAAVARVVSRIDDLVGPDEAPARVHGDLWSGNVHAGSDGRPWLIDPAAHGAHRELDLAMLCLFGSISRRTRAAYEEIGPLAPGHEERVALYQLQPLLVHAILFGGSYGAAVGRAARLYA